MRAAQKKKGFACLLPFEAHQRKEEEERFEYIINQQHNSCVKPPDHLYIILSTGLEKHLNG